MKIFGLGLTKTGTTSLHEALNDLGFSSVHYPSDKNTYEELTRANYRLSILNKFDAITDITVVPFFEYFDQLYPESKFILTMRNKDQWLDSVEFFWGNVLIGGHWNYIVDTYLSNDVPRDYAPEARHYFKLTFFLHAAVYGTLKFSRQVFSDVYDRHLDRVMKYFDGRDNLLVLDICGGDGWGKLCSFLNRPEPSTPFPHENKRDRDVALL